MDGKTIQEKLNWLGGIRFEPYARCLTYWATQTICHSWENISHSRPQRFRLKGKVWPCQFAGVLQDVAAGVSAIGHSEVIGE